MPPVGSGPGTGPNGRYAINGLEVVSPWGRLGATLLDAVLAVVTLGIGWLIWGLVVVGDGHTPARKLLKMQTVTPTTGIPVGFVPMVLVRGIALGVLSAIVSTVALGIPVLMFASWVTVFTTAKSQTIADLLSSTVVVARPD